MKAPAGPVLPSGPMTVISVRPGQAGQTIEINNPNNPGSKVHVVVPENAKPGQKMAVPLPKKGESVTDVQNKQKDLTYAYRGGGYRGEGREQLRTAAAAT